MRRILLRILGIRRSLARLLPERSLAQWLAHGLPQSGPRLQATLTNGNVVLGRIPDKFKEKILLGFVVDDDGRLVDLAADSDDVPADNRRRITERCGLRRVARNVLIRSYRRAGEASGSRARSQATGLCSGLAWLT